MTRRAKPMAAATAAPTPSIPAIPPADVLGRLAALQNAETPALKQQWRDLFGKEPPPHNRARKHNQLFSTDFTHP